MHAQSTLTLLAALVLAVAPATVHADAIPTAPGPGQTFNEGQNCSTSWTPDKTGQWKQMTISLMTGDNLSQIQLADIATSIDGTSSSLTSISFPCPSVTPNSAIYFYKYTALGQTTPEFTTRFAIANAQGQTTPPPNATQPDGEKIPWGVGKLVGSGSSSTTSSSSTSSSGTTSSSSSSSSSSTSSSSSSASSSSTVSKSSSSSSTSSSSSSTPSLTTSRLQTSTSVVVISPTSSANSTGSSGAGSLTLQVGRSSVYAVGAALGAVAAGMVLGL